MTKVTFTVETAPGLRLSVDRELADFYATIGKWTVLLRDDTLSVNETYGQSPGERPILSVPA